MKGVICMLPVRVLVVGNRRNLLRRLRLTLESEGYLVTVARDNGAPALLLARVVPDLLIAQLPPSRTAIEGWRRAIDTFRAHRSLSVLALMPASAGEAEHKAVEEVADLGIAGRPLRKRAVLECLENWYSAEAPLLRAS
jgi:DNA-binding response OmpR family regulator